MRTHSAFGIAGTRSRFGFTVLNTPSLYFPEAELYFVTGLEAKAASCPRTPYYLTGIKNRARMRLSICPYKRDFAKNESTALLTFESRFDC